MFKSPLAYFSYYPYLLKLLKVSKGNKFNRRLNNNSFGNKGKQRLVVLFHRRWKSFACKKNKPIYLLILKGLLELPPLFNNPLYLLILKG